jgi:hypothetical protein
LLVVVNVTKFRSDAIIVSAKYGINVVSLPKFQEMDVRKWLKKDVTSFEREEYGEKGKGYR